MNRTRQILKKSAAAVLCASLILSGSSTAFAAGSYQETEKTALANVVSKLPEAWDGYLENYQKACKGTRLPLTNSQTVFRKPGILILRITRNLPPEVKAT